MTPEQRAEIRKRADAATTAPWSKRVMQVVGDVIVASPHGDIAVCCGDDGSGVDTPDGYMSYAGNSQEHRDGDFISHARQDVPALLDALEAAEAERVELRATLTNRQRYIHCEMHVDEDHAPIGSWTDCQKPTCAETRTLLAAAGRAPGRGEG